MIEGFWAAGDTLWNPSSATYWWVYFQTLFGFLTDEMGLIWFLLRLLPNMCPTIGCVQARWASDRWGSLDGGSLRWHFSREAHRDVILPSPGICFVEAENTAGMKLSLWRTQYSPICMKKRACVALFVLLYLVYMESASNTMHQNKLGSFSGRRKTCSSSNFHCC